MNSIAKKRCAKLLQMAAIIHSQNPILSKRYVDLARRIAKRHRFPLDSKSFCKSCGVVFIPAKTLKVRTSAKDKVVLYLCLECGAARKFGYGKRGRRGQEGKRQPI
ncbi:hypothetical protein HY995_05685 [Candidatus Micrarchaeota archaeon]|nr:hypothetical protein [Candidatus Micrarchaeota archaeon]